MRPQLLAMGLFLYLAVIPVLVLWLTPCPHSPLAVNSKGFIPLAMFHLQDYGKALGLLITRSSFSPASLRKRMRRGKGNCPLFRMNCLCSATTTFINTILLPMHFHSSKQAAVLHHLEGTPPQRDSAKEFSFTVAGAKDLFFSMTSTHWTCKRCNGLDFLIQSELGVTQ